MAENITPNLVVLINDTPYVEYDREIALSDDQQQSLNLLDSKMKKGITLQGSLVPSPNLEQKIQFVAANLISALLNNNDEVAAASCAYIANALPDLKQIRSIENNGEISIELIFDKPYQPESKLNFVPINKLS